MAFKYTEKSDNYTGGSIGGTNPTAEGYGSAFPNPLAAKSGSADFYKNAFEWEPKYQNRFIMGIPLNDKETIPAYLIKASSKPQLENGEIVLDHLNIQRKVKGKSKWQNITISLYDPIIPSGAQTVMQWIRTHHESATGRDGYSIGGYKKDITLSGLSGPGEVVEEWTLEGAYIQSCNWGSYDWSAEEVVTIEMTIGYDFAFLHY